MSEVQPRYTVLLVDDNPDLVELLVPALRWLGNFTVESANNGIAGLERCIELRPDCMVIDVKMPGLDGYQLVRALRGDPDTAFIPLVMLTALAQDKDAFTGLAAGADQYLIKPVKPQDLVAAIQQAIALGEADRQHRMETLAEE